MLDETELLGKFAEENSFLGCCAQPDEFGFEASRTAWRLALDVMWSASTVSAAIVRAALGSGRILCTM